MASMPSQDRLIHQHVDDWLRKVGERNLRSGDVGENYAAFVITYFRLEEEKRSIAKEWMVRHKLYCNAFGRRFKCIGASSYGNLVLQGDDMARLTAFPDECSEWGPVK